MQAPPVGLGTNQEMFVASGRPGHPLRWIANPPEPGFLELSEEAEHDLVSSQLDEEIRLGRQRTERRWQMQREARRLLQACHILRTVKSGPSKGESREHSFAVVDCCRHPLRKHSDDLNYFVEVWRSPDSGRAFFANVKRCGSVWTCPICAARITEKKRKELHEGLERYKAAGGNVYLLTLTIPHHAGNQTSVWRDKLLDAYRKLRNRTFWRHWAKSIGLDGSVRALEVTYGGNGAHVHLHALLFCMPTADTCAPCSSLDMLSEWKSACAAVGLPQPTAHGVDIRDGRTAGSYVSKWGLDCELTKSHVKHGNGHGRTPWDLLEASLDGDPDAGRLFVEYAIAFFGQRQLVWSTGLRAKIGLAREKPDQELAEEATQCAVIIGEIPPDDWSRVLHFDAQARVLTAAEKRGSDGIKAVLDSLKFRSHSEREKRIEQGIWRN